MTRHTPETLIAWLDAHDIPTTTYAHEKVFTVEASKHLRGVIPGGHCKSLFLTDRKGALFLVVALEDTPVNLKTLHLHLGCGRLSFGKAELMDELLGVYPGAVTPFGLVHDAEGRISVVLDAALMRLDLANFHPLENDRSTTISTADLVRFVRATGHEPLICDLAALDAAPIPSI